MAYKITYDRTIGPTPVVSGSDATTTTLSIAAEAAPTTFTATNYTNFIFQVSNPGDTTPTQAAGCTDTQGSTYNLLKEVQFAGYALDVFSRLSAAPSVSSTVTVNHQPSKKRLIVNSEWYNLGNFEKISSAYASSAVAQVDLGEFRTGSKDWLVMAVLGIGGTSFGDSVSIPDDWNLLFDDGTNYGDGSDIRIVSCYQICKNRMKVDFRPVLSNPRVWGATMFCYKEKL